MFVCLKSRNQQHEKKFEDFYFKIHKRYGFTPDYKDPVEFATYEELRNALFYLKRLKIRRIMPKYKDYESVVWGDILAGVTIANVGNEELINQVKESCKHYPEQWRTNILETITEDELFKEGKEVIVKQYMVNLLVKNSSADEIENCGGVENLINKSLSLLQKQLNDKVSLDEKAVMQSALNISENDMKKAGLESSRVKPVTLLFEKYIYYQEKTKPSHEKCSALS